MCKKCGYKNGDTMHLLYWQAEWFKRFITTWWHIINRRAYHRWCKKNCNSFIRSLKTDIPDEGLRMELDEFLK
jgi:hypothetical protein